MPFKDADKAEVLESIMRFYRQTLELPQACVYPVVNPLAPPRLAAEGDFFVTIALGDGAFPTDEQGKEHLLEQADFIATGYTRIQLDKATADESFLLHPTRGALWIQKRLLSIVEEELTDEPGTGILASRVYAKTSHRPNYDNEQMIGWTGISFGVDFSWAL